MASVKLTDIEHAVMARIAMRSVDAEKFAAANGDLPSDADAVTRHSVRLGQARDILTACGVQVKEPANGGDLGQVEPEAIQKADDRDAGEADTVRNSDGPHGDSQGRTSGDHG